MGRKRTLPHPIEGLRNPADLLDFITYFEDIALFEVIRNIEGYSDKSDIRILWLKENEKPCVRIYFNLKRSWASHILQAFLERERYENLLTAESGVSYLRIILSDFGFVGAKTFVAMHGNGLTVQKLRSLKSVFKPFRSGFGKGTLFYYKKP